MHVAYIHQHFSTRQGATGTRSYEMSRALLAAGHRVSMICGVNDATKDLFNSTDTVSQLSIDGIDVHVIKELYSTRLNFWQRIRGFKRFADLAGRLVSRTAADLVFATSTPLTVGIPGMKGARRLGCPFVFEVRDLWPELPIALGFIKNPALKWYTRRMERNIYRAARQIIALSPGMKDGICRTGYPAERVIMIPNGCDLELFKPDDTPLDDPRFGPSGDYRLVFTGAHGLANGLGAVLDAAAELLRRGEKGIRFVFIGGGKEREALIARAQREGTYPNTTWLEFIPKNELSRLLPRFDAGMMILKNVPSFYYGTSPNKFFDYIACGIPVLNNYPGWVADMIGERRCGLAVPPDDARAFADACVWLRDHRQEAEGMGGRGRALAEERFVRDALAAQFVATLERARAEFRAA